VWLYVHTGGHHVRTIPRAQVVAVEVDEDERSTRLAIHLNPPSLDLRFRSHNQAQRGWLRDLADVLQLRLMKG